MKRRVQILRVSKNEIIIRKPKRRRNWLIPSFLCIVLFVIIFASNNIVSNYCKESVLKVYNPVSSLYSDNSEAIFTSGNIDKDDMSVTIPIKGAKMEVLEDGRIEFVIGNSIIVMACDNGKVDKIGTTLDGQKYIQILHKSGLVSVISNVEIIGVKMGDIVKSGQDIATVKEGQKAWLSLYLNENQITNLKVSKSKIVWEN